MRRQDVACKKCGIGQNYTNRSRHESTCGVKPVCQHCHKPPHKLELAEHELWCKDAPRRTCVCGRTFKLKTKFQSHKCSKGKASITE